MNNNENIEDIFRRRFRNEKSPVSDRVWENIKKNLPPEDSGERRFPFYIAILLLLIGMIAGGYFNFRKTTSDSSIAVRQKKEKLEKTDGTKSTNASGKGEDLNENAFEKSTETFDSSTNDNDRVENKTDEKYSEYSTKNLLPENENKNNANPSGKTGVEYTTSNSTPNKDKKSKNNLASNSSRNNSENKNSAFIALSDDLKNERENSTGSEDEKSLNSKPNNNIENPVITKSGNLTMNNDERVDGKDTDEHRESEKNDGNEKEKISAEENLHVNINSNPENSNEKSNTTKEGERDGNSIDNTGLPTEEKLPTTELKNNYDSAFADRIPVLLTQTDNNNANPDSVVSDSTQDFKEEKPEDTLTINERKKKGKKENFITLSTDLFGSAAFTFRSLSGEGEGLSNREEYERAKLNLGGGIRFNYGLNENILLSGGVGVVSYGEKYDYLREVVSYYEKYQFDTIWVQDSLTYNYYVTKDTITIETKRKTEYSGRNYYRYMELPLSASYMFKTGKVGLGFTGGVTVNFLLKAYTVRLADNVPGSPVELVEQHSGKSSPFRPVTFGAFINPVITYSIKNNWVVFAEPGFKFLLNSVYRKEGKISLKPYGLNVNIGLRYIFK